MMRIIQNVYGESLIIQEVKQLILRKIPPSLSTHSIRVERVW